MNPNPKVTIVSSECGDWYALYVDGVKKYENHSIDYGDVLFALGIPFETSEVSDSMPKRTAFLLRKQTFQLLDK